MKTKKICERCEKLLTVNLYDYLATFAPLHCETCKEKIELIKDLESSLLKVSKQDEKYCSYHETTSSHDLQSDFFCIPIPYRTLLLYSRIVIPNQTITKNYQPLVHSIQHSTKTNHDECPSVCPK